MKLYFEIINDFGPTPEEVTEDTPYWENSTPEPNDVDCWHVQDLAEHIYWDRDGWDMNWPVSFRVWNYKKWRVGDFTVDVETVPQFFAMKTKEPEKDE
jgi:hypothetical protein